MCFPFSIYIFICISGNFGLIEKVKVSGVNNIMNNHARFHGNQASRCQNVLTNQTD